MCGMPVEAEYLKTMVNIFNRTIGGSMIRHLLCCIFIFQSLVAQWTQENGPYGGPVTSLKFNGAYLFALGGNGVYRTGNNGDSWIHVTPEEINKNYVSCMSVKDGNLFVGNNAGVYLSTNNGTDWKFVGDGMPRLAIWALTVSGTNLIAGNAYGDVYVSPDDGTSWQMHSLAAQSPPIQTFLVYGSMIYAGTTLGIYSSANGGTTWTNITNDLADKNVLTLAAQNGKIYAGTTNGIFITDNYGTNWERLNSSTTVRAILFSGDDIYIATSTSGVMKSINGGYFWSSLVTGMNESNTTALALSGIYLYAGTGSIGVYRSQNGGDSWAPANKGITSRSILSLETKGTILYAGTFCGIQTSNDNGATWHSSENLVDRLKINRLLNTGSALYAATSNGVYMLESDGSTWTQKNAYMEVNDLANIGSYLFAGTTGYSVIYSTNGGFSWWSSGLAGYPNNFVNTLGINGSNLFASSWNGTTGAFNSMFFSPDNGEHWDPINTGFPSASAFAFISKGIRLFAGTMQGIYVTVNNGTNWNPSNSGLGNLHIRSLALTGNTLFTGTDDGVYRSSDDGAHWEPINTGLTGHTSISSLKICGQYLVAGTWARSVWRRPLSEIVSDVSRESDKICLDFSLSQNYPNPFNPTTTIRYALPSQSIVRLSIYNLLGREIATLVNEEQSAGWKEVKWNTVGVASGIYFYKLTAGSFVEVKKMLLIR
jgi:ligand-binding sensor domain-containing protein